MAALEEVPVSYYESAELDGVGPVRKFIYITLPSIAHVLVYQAILGFINAFQYFQQVYIITNASSGSGAGSGYANGGPGNSILMYPLYIFHNAFVFLKMGKASSMAWLLFLLVSVLTCMMTKLSRKVTQDAGVE
jgi:multiple sugar transport system permease protein